MPTNMKERGMFFRSIRVDSCSLVHPQDPRACRVLLEGGLVGQGSRPIGDYAQSDSLEWSHVPLAVAQYLGVGYPKRTWQTLKQ